MSSILRASDLRKGVDQNGKVDPTSKKASASQQPLQKAQYSSTSMHEYGDDQVLAILPTGMRKNAVPKCSLCGLPFVVWCTYRQFPGQELQAFPVIPPAILQHHCLYMVAAFRIPQLCSRIPPTQMMRQRRSRMALDKSVPS